MHSSYLIFELITIYVFLHTLIRMDPSNTINRSYFGIRRKAMLNRVIGYYCMRVGTYEDLSLR